MIYRVKCFDYTNEAQGIALIEKMIVFVPFLLIDEIADIKIVHKGSKIWHGQIVNLIQKSPNRCKSICHLFKQCGGCHLLHMNYNEQLRFKKIVVTNTLKSLAGININIAEVIASEQFYYRNKVAIPIGCNEKNEVVAGYYSLNSNKIIPNRRCYLAPKEFTDIINQLLELFNKYQIVPYKNSRGLIRHIFLRRGDRISVTLVVTSFFFANRDKLIADIKKIKMISRLTLNKNNEKTNVILGKEEEVIYGDLINGQIFNISFALPDHAFFQINTRQIEKLYQTAITLANFSKSERVLDAFCGMGTIAISIAPYVKSVVAVDNVAAAITSGMMTAQNNNISNIQFIVADVNNLAKNILKEIDAVIIDPPRKGCSSQFLALLQELRIKKIIYISCYPGTLARDLKLLLDNYEVSAIVPVDMFPQTTHVEIVTCLTIK